MAKVYKKISANGLLCLYLGKRDFVDHMDSVDVVDGVVKVDTSELDGRKVWVKLSCTFHYGWEDLDVIGFSFRKDFWIQHIQIYPPTMAARTANTHMQDVLVKKVGADGYPFTFNIPTNLPCSLTVHPAPGDKGKACGVDFEVKAFVTNEADKLDEEAHKKDTCNLVIRKIQFAPGMVTAGPKVSVCKRFIMSDKSIHLEASIEKEVYLHGEPIPVKVKINNGTNKVVKKIKLSIEQTTDIVLYSADKYTKVVLCEEFWDRVKGGSTFEKEYRVTPLLANIKEKCGLALDGRLKDEDAHLASSTIFQAGMDKEVQGILVSYRIKVDVMVASSGLLGNIISSDIITELPLILMSPEPAAGYTSASKSFCRY